MLYKSFKGPDGVTYGYTTSITAELFGKPILELIISIIILIISCFITGIEPGIMITSYSLIIGYIIIGVIFNTSIFSLLSILPLAYFSLLPIQAINCEFLKTSVNNNKSTSIINFSLYNSFKNNTILSVIIIVLLSIGLFLSILFIIKSQNRKFAYSKQYKYFFIIFAVLFILTGIAISLIKDGKYDYHNNVYKFTYGKSYFYFIIKSAIYTIAIISIIFNIQKLQKYDHDKLINKTMNLKDNEKLHLYLMIGNEGYYEGYNLVGNIFYENNNFKKALYYYNKAIEKKEIDYILYNIGNIYSNEKFEEYNIDTAIAYYKKADYYRAYLALGDIYMNAGNRAALHEYKDLTNAKIFYKKALNTGYSNINLIQNIAIIYSTESDMITAAAYAYIADKMGSTAGLYELYKNSITENSSIWTKYIESLQSYKEIDDMIIKVNNYIKEIHQ